MKVRNALAAAAGIGILGIAAAGNILYNMALTAHGDKTAVLSAEENRTSKIPGSTVDLDSIPFEDGWTASSYDGIILHGNIVDRDSDVWVIAMHGYSASGKTVYEKCEGFNERGYSLLCPDMRGHGESEGEYIGMGWHDRLDILSWIEYLNDRYAPSSIILYGISMGASAVMMTSGESLPANVGCIIEDCGYVEAKDELRYQGKVVFNLPYYPVIWAGDLITRKRAGWSFKEASAVKQLSKAEVPMLFIHGDKDRFVPVENVYRAYEACASEKELLVVEGAGHVESQDIDGAGYWSRVFDFIDRYID